MSAPQQVMQREVVKQVYLKEKEIVSKHFLMHSFYLVNFFQKKCKVERNMFGLFLCLHGAGRLSHLSTVKLLDMLETQSSHLLTV